MIDIKYSDQDVLQEEKKPIRRLKHPRDTFSASMVKGASFDPI